MHSHTFLLDDCHRFRAGKIEQNAVHIHGDISAFLGFLIGRINEQEVFVRLRIGDDPVALEFAV